MSPAGIYAFIGDVSCIVSGTTGASCTATAGNYDDQPGIGYRTDNGWLNVSTPAAKSETTSATLKATDISWFTVTLRQNAVQSTASNTQTSAPDIQSTTITQLVTTTLIFVSQGTPSAYSTLVATATSTSESNISRNPSNAVVLAIMAISFVVTF